MHTHHSTDGDSARLRKDEGLLSQQDGQERQRRRPNQKSLKDLRNRQSSISQRECRLSTLRIWKWSN